MHWFRFNRLKILALFSSDIGCPGPVWLEKNWPRSLRTTLRLFGGLSVSQLVHPCDATKQGRRYVYVCTIRMELVGLNVVIETPKRRRLLNATHAKNEPAVVEMNRTGLLYDRVIWICSSMWNGKCAYDRGSSCTRMATRHVEISWGEKDDRGGDMDFREKAVWHTSSGIVVWFL